MKAFGPTNGAAFAAAVLTLLCLPAGASRAAPDDDSLAGAARALFAAKVYPVFEARCFPCHGEAGDREAELDMRSLEGLLKGGESGLPSLVPGQPEESLIHQAVLRHGELKMPPQFRNRLSEEEIEWLGEWILAGAPWAEPRPPAEDGWAYDLKDEDVWAFKPRMNPEVPQIPDPQSAIQNPIDSFILEKLNAHGLNPAPPADRRTLIRRATYDLTGLPPTPEEIEAFLNDASPDAFDRVIERLLASPHYGEHWARHWLDVVRYADTDGFSNDYERPNAWRYRDYVIRSFNDDKPYDQFIVEQIAGDELPDPGPEALIAVGMLRMGPWEHTAMSVEAVTRQLFLDDVTHSVATAFMGLTMECAKCHDHKFDPIPTRDYYRMLSIFTPVQFEQRAVEFLTEENTSDFETGTERVQQRIRQMRQRIAVIRKKREQAVREFLKERGVSAVRELPIAERPEKEFGLNPGDLEHLRVLRKRLEYFERELERYQPRAYSVSSAGLKEKIPTPVTHVLVGGALESPGEPVSPALLRAVYEFSDAPPRIQIDGIPRGDEGRRLALARWIASPEHPLTARVMVNRLWQGHFGRGIVETSNNFGKMGKRPTHPELLDWLANYFVENGWSVKEMHRLILRSAVYRQATEHPEIQRVREVDPEQNLRAHALPRRLRAEELRDGMLLVSGQLSRTMGGPGIFPEINLEAALQPRSIMGSIAPAYLPSPSREQRNRRTIYSFQIRSLANPMLDVFNAPTPEFSCERRDETIIAPQAFALFNSRAAHDAALAMAHRLTRSSSNLTEQITSAFQLAYGRDPTPREHDICRRHVQEMLEHHRTAEPAAFEFPASVARSLIEEITGEPFLFEEELDFSGYEYHLRSTEVGPETRALAELCLVLFNSNEFVYVY